MSRIKKIPLVTWAAERYDLVPPVHALCQLADRVGMRCEAGFNGVKMWARPGDNPARLVEAFYEQLKLPAQHYKIAQAD